MKLKAIITGALGCLPPLGIIVYTLFFYRDNFLAGYVAAFALLILTFFWVAQLTRSRWSTFLRTTALLFGITYVVTEVVVYLLLAFGMIRPDMQFFFRGFEGTDSRIAVYDSVCGYRAVPGNTRCLHISNGIVEIDHITKANSAGWYSAREYSFAKKSPSVKRWMVLGDSYSAGVAVPDAWPDLVQEIYSKNGNDSLEFYNFSTDGAGIQNWYRIFFKEILPRYDFDGIIIAASFEKKGIPDFDRKLVIMHSAGSTNYVSYLDITKNTTPSRFPLEEAVPICGIYTSSRLDEIKESYSTQNHSAFHLPEPGLHFLAIFYGVGDGLLKLYRFTTGFRAYSKPYESYFNLAGEPYQMEYFDNRYQYGFMLKEIIAYCKANNKVVTLIAVPDYRHTLQYIHGEPCIYRNEMRFLSEYYDTGYFDGFTMFDGRDAAFVSDCFYQYDLHWNQKGVTLFAQKAVESRIF